MSILRRLLWPVAALAILTAVVLPATRAEESRESGARVLRVGPGHAISTIADVAKIARDGDTVEIEAGEYIGDVAVWAQKSLSIRGINGRPRLIAGGTSAEGKGIWVVRGGTIEVENVTLSGARVPHKNGAGIRLERGKLVVRDVSFVGNETGLLTANDPTIELVIENCEFGENGTDDAHRHNHALYVGTIKRLTVQGSWFRSGRIGHLIKSRAADSLILYNRIADGVDGTASYEVELPNGGRALVMGNLIQQGSQTQNPVIVSFGAEGYKYDSNVLHLAFNTLVNDRPQGGVFVHAWPGKATVQAINNIFVGKGTLDLQVPSRAANNRTLEWTEFVLPQRLDYRLRRSSGAVGAATAKGHAEGAPLVPMREYRHPASSTPIPAKGRLSPGALQSVGS